MLSRSLNLSRSSCYWRCKPYSLSEVLLKVGAKSGTFCLPFNGGIRGHWVLIWRAERAAWLVGRGQAHWSARWCGEQINEMAMRTKEKHKNCKAIVLSNVTSRSMKSSYFFSPLDFWNTFLSASSSCSRFYIFKNLVVLVLVVVVSQFSQKCITFPNS